MKHFEHKNKGTCSSKVSFDIDDENRLHNVRFVSGCAGNLSAIGTLVEGKDAKEIADMLLGNRCGYKDTSCADQLAKGILEALSGTAAKPVQRVKRERNPEVMITMESGDTIRLELYPEIAPNTVNNFISLVRKQFYDGLIFHRVIPGFMIQGGDPQGTGMGGPGYEIPGEFSENGFENELSHKRGVISMARAMDPDSAGSQFFIMHADGNFLDGQYAAFGAVRDGMETVDKIAAAKTDRNDRPYEEQRIHSMTVETFGETYEEPQKS